MPLADRDIGGALTTLTVSPQLYRSPSAANAAKCAEWAANAKSPSAKQTFLDLAQTWQNLALETEAIDAEFENAAAAAQVAMALKATERK